jgi:hypothetical protein
MFLVSCHVNFSTYTRLGVGDNTLTMHVHLSLATPWHVGRPRGKFGSFERHLLSQVSCHFDFLTTNGRSAVNQSQPNLY